MEEVAEANRKDHPLPQAVPSTFQTTVWAWLWWSHQIVLYCGVITAKSRSALVILSLISWSLGTITRSSPRAPRQAQAQANMVWSTRLRLWAITTELKPWLLAHLRYRGTTIDSKMLWVQVCPTMVSATNFTIVSNRLPKLVLGKPSNSEATEDSPRTQASSEAKWTLPKKSRTMRKSTILSPTTQSLKSLAPARDRMWAQPVTKMLVTGEALAWIGNKTMMMRAMKKTVTSW